VLSEVLRAGRVSTAGLSPLSTPDSILMCYQKLRSGQEQERSKHAGESRTQPPRCVQRACIRDRGVSSSRLYRALPAPPIKGDYSAQPECQKQRGAGFGDSGSSLTVLALAVAVLALAVLTERWQHRRSQQT
jgi:hypothetical protein